MNSLDLASSQDTTRTASTYVERILDRERPADHVVLSDACRSMTIEEVRREVYSLARVLADVGLGPGSRIGLLVDNTCSAVTVRYAANLIGCATVYLPDAGAPARLASFLTETAVDTVVVTPDRAGHLAAAFWVDPDLSPTVMSAGPVRDGDLAVVADLLERARSADSSPLAAVASDGAACLVTSGGTTGDPKASVRTMPDWTALVTGREDGRRRQLVCTPLAYVAQVQADQTLVGGGSVVLRPASMPFDAAGVLATVEAERITHLCLVEPALVQLLDHDDLWRRDLSSLVAISHIGADAGSTLRTRLWVRARMAGLGNVLVHTYGSSEVGLVSLLSGDDYSGAHPHRMATAGRPLPGVTVTIDGREPRDGASPREGEIVVGSAAVCLGTTRFPEPELDPAHVAAATPTRRTGDWGSLDAHGRLTVRGRMVDGVTGPDGLRFPVDVQEALCSHADVRYAVAIPARDAGHDTGGFVAAVTVRPGRRTSAEELEGHVRTRHPGVPVDRVVVLPSMPVTEQGKPDRIALAAVLAPTS